MSQRLATYLLTVLMMVLGALAGTPGSFPVTADGSYLTPEAIFGLATPVVMVFSTLFFVYKTIETRVATGELNPGDLLALLKMEEFWVALVAAIAGIIQIFKPDLLNADAQAMLVNMLMGMSQVLLYFFSKRSPGVTAAAMTVKPLSNPFSEGR